MSREKQIIEEMARVVSYAFFEDYNNGCDPCTDTVAEHLYLAGYRKSEWISVEDDTPKFEFDRVLVLLRYDYLTLHMGDQRVDTDRFVDGRWVRWGTYVTHWMPLPETVKMKGGAE